MKGGVQMYNINIIELKKRMIEKRLDTAVALADAAKVERNTVSAILNGQRKPSLKVMYAIAEVLELSSVEAGNIFFCK